MARTVESTPQLRVKYALHKARQFRHHPDCRCGMWHGACSQGDFEWTQAMNDELEAMRR